MKIMKITRHWLIGSSVLLAVLLGCVGLGYARLTPNDQVRRRGGTTFSGRAVVVDATVGGIKTVVSDTGPLSASGGNLEASLLSVSVPGVITGEVAHATTIGQADRSRSEASLAYANVTAGGHVVTADFLMSRAEAVCGHGGEASASGSSELANLVIDGQAITVSGSPNQTVTFPGGAGSVIINEQTASSSSRRNAAITVNALHVIVLNPLTGETVADVIVASSHADITCSNTPCTGGDFITGGGWITLPGNSRGTFGVAGGLRSRGLWGHLTYIDHSTGMMVKGTSVTNYVVTGTTSRRIDGTAEINGQGGFTYTVNVADNGEPGRADTFMIQLSSGYTAGGNLAGGNIQLHQPCR